LFDGPVTLYAVKEARLLDILRRYPDPKAQERVNALLDLKNNGQDSYLVTIKSIEIKRKRYDGIVSGPEEVGLWVDGVTKKELTKDHVLVDYTGFVERFAKCDEPAGGERVIRLDRD
jgi:hypothetical protein